MGLKVSLHIDLVFLIKKRRQKLFNFGKPEYFLLIVLRAM